MSKTCAICLDKCSNTRKLYRCHRGKAIPVCPHVYCNKCISKWSKIETSCPQCKRKYNALGNKYFYQQIPMKVNHKKMFLFLSVRSCKHPLLKKQFEKANQALEQLLHEDTSRAEFLNKFVDGDYEAHTYFFLFLKCLKSSQKMYREHIGIPIREHFPEFVEMMRSCCDRLIAKRMRV